MESTATIFSFIRPLRQFEFFVNFCLGNSQMKFLSSQNTIIQEKWKIISANNAHLYNGSKFRLGLFDSTGKIDVSITCYKDFLGTNCASNNKELLLRGKEMFNDSQAYMADPIGVGGLLVSKDSKAIFIRRAAWTAEYGGKIDRPGGHPEPHLASTNIQEDSQGGSDTEDYSVYSRLTNEEVKEEIFLSCLREIVDEVNVPMDCLMLPLLLGMVRNEEMAGRPSLEFLVRCTMNASDIENLYKKQTQSEVDESTAIMTLSLEDITNHNLLTKPIWKDLTPAAQGSLLLFKYFFPNLKNIETIN